MAVPPKHFGQLKKVTEQVTDIPVPRGHGVWVYELVRTIVWVDTGLP